MKRKRFAVEQIVAVLRQVEMGMPVADAIRQVGGVCFVTGTLGLRVSRSVAM